MSAPLTREREPETIYVLVDSKGEPLDASRTLSEARLRSCAWLTVCGVRCRVLRYSREDRDTKAAHQWLRRWLRADCSDDELELAIEGMYKFGRRALGYKP